MQEKFNLSGWALRHRSLVLFLMVALTLGGFLSYLEMGRKEDPDFTFRAMVVRAYWPGSSAPEMELQVVDKLEKALQGLATIDYTESYSRAGEGQILIHLRSSTRGRDVTDAWYQIRKRVADIKGDLPSGLVGPVFMDEFGDTFGNIYAFTADGFTYAELKKYVEATRDELLRIPDVDKVDLIGAQDDKIYVEYANAKLSNLGVSPFQINQLIAATNAVSPAGVVEGKDERLYLRVTGGFDAVEHLRRLPITINGKTFRLGDVAEIKREPANPPTTKMRFDGREAIGIGISMRKGGDVLKMGQQINETLRRVKGNLPVGIEFHAVSDQPAVVGTAINTFMRSLLEAVVIVLAVSFLSLGWRTGIVVALSIPVVLTLTFLGMRLAGIELQRVSLGALIIALGLMVDDAIIAVEMMALKLEQGWDRFRAATFAYASTAFPMLTGTLITAAGFMPVGLAQSDAGEYTFSIFAVVGISLIISWFVAVIFTPFLGYRLLPENVRHEEHDVYQGRFYRWFRKLVTWCVIWRKTTLLATFLAFALSLVVFSVAVPKQFFPASNRPELMVDMWLPYTASFEASEAEAKRLEAILLKDKDVVNVTTFVGTGAPRFYLPLNQQLPNLNFAQLMVMTKGEAVRDNVRQRTQAILDKEFPMVRGRALGLENGPPVGYPVQFRILGPDAEILQQTAAKVAQVMRENHNTRTVNTDWGEKVKVARLVADQDRLRTFGITTQELAQRLQLAVSGVVATQYRDGNDTIDVVARLGEAERKRLDYLRDLRILLPNGRAVPLSQLADIRLENEESIIWRRNRIRALTVRCDVAGAQAPDVTMALMPAINKINLELPPGYRIEVGGSLESSHKSQSPIVAVMPLMLLVVTTLLMLQLQSFQRTVMVLLSAPLGMIGVTISLLLFRAPFGFVAMLGVIALAGMIMRNSVILMDQIEQDISQGREIWQAVIESAVRRFRPIMLTAAAAILAMIPLSRDVFWGPMAIAIMGGLFVATVLTLLFLPALYVAWYRIKPTAAKATT